MRRIWYQMSDLSSDDLKTLAVYFDATDRFPFQSEEYMLVAVFKNSEHVEPLANRTGPAYVTAYRTAYVNLFKSKGHAFSIAKLDNESSILLVFFFKDEANIEYYFIAVLCNRPQITRLIYL